MSDQSIPRNVPRWRLQVAADQVDGELPSADQLAAVDAPPLADPAQPEQSGAGHGHDCSQSAWSPRVGPMPILRDVRARIELTVAGRDTEAIPKVPDAGTVVNGVQVMHNGVRVVHGAYNGEWMSEVISRLGGHHEPQEELAFHGVLERLAATEPAPLMLELGAGWAYYSLWFLRADPPGRAFLVEPDPGMVDLGRRNFALNDRDRRRSCRRPSAPPATGPEPFDCWSDRTVRAVPAKPAVALDRFAIDTRTTVLADVQGAEVSLLEGARDVLPIDGCGSFSSRRTTTSSAGTR